MLFKNETVVRIVCAGVFVFSGAVFGQTNNNNSNNNNNPNPGDINAIYSACEQKGGSPDDIANCVKTRKQGQLDLNRAGNGKDEDECREDTKKFTEEIGKLKGACPTVGLSSDAGECAKALRDCLKKDSRKSKACPKDGADLTKLQDEAQKIEDDIATLNEKGGKFSEKESELNEEQNKQLNDINTKRSKLQTDFTTQQAKRRSETEKQMNDQQKATLAQVQQTQMQYDQLTAQIKMIPTQMAQAQLQNYDQQVTKLKLDCHGQAIEKVQQRIDKDQKKIANGTLRCGGFNGCVKTMGMTDEQTYEALANYYERKCLNDGAYITQVNLAAKTANIARQALGKQRDTLVQQQQTMIKNMNQQLQQAGIDKMQAYKDAATAEWAARNAYTNELTSLDNQQQTVANSTQGKLAAIANQRTLLNQQITQKQGYLSEKQKLLKTAQDASKGQDYSKKDAQKVQDAAGAAESAAGTAQGTCDCDTKPKNKKACKAFQAFLTKAENRSSSAFPSGDEDGDGDVTPASATGSESSGGEDRHNSEKPQENDRYDNNEPIPVNYSPSTPSVH